MKVSKEERIKIRKKLIRTAVDLMNDEGISKVSLARIARKAGIAPSTLYNYFSGKEELIFAYFGDTLEDVIDSFENISDFQDYGLQEKIQLLFEKLFSAYEDDLVFVEEALDRIHSSPFSSMTGLMGSRKKFIRQIEDFLDEAVESEEIPRIPFMGMASLLIGDYYLGMLHYWLKDTSKDKGHTSQLLDMTLELMMVLLRSNVPSKVLDLGMFFLRNHTTAWPDRMEHLVRNFKDLDFLGRYCEPR